MAATPTRRARVDAPRADAGADEASAPSGGPMTAFESSGDEDEEAALVATSSYSPLAADASDAPELPRLDRAWRDAARVFVRRLQLGLSRRWRPASRGRRFDLRRTLRASLQTGGEPLAPRWLRRPRRAPRIVLLVDGSRSMSAYARTALQLAVALASATQPGGGVHVFDRPPAGDRRRAAGRGRRDRGVSSACITPGPEAPPSARACATSCSGSASAWLDATPS